MSLDDAVPSAAPLAAAGAPQRPTSPDGYPNINVPAAAASPQLSESDRQRLTGELEGLRQRQATPLVSSAQALSEEERLRLLARSHGDRALSEIDAAGQ
ncbi:hypothetical protein [Chelativorans sp. M5D2P16]|uniref:hypothetical protein n=1 Tax=Chelativorans sp. M5D2P16 TaxID=3095678 RepID=UPI002ACAD633|nr:hypothetical protein [Chelativorans sp. M5D2P16]MDZ5698320.1 hypothetical protein [Chelativorans sp. M5D2P16]